MCVGAIAILDRACANSDLPPCRLLSKFDHLLTMVPWKEPDISTNRKAAQYATLTRYHPGVVCYSVQLLATLMQVEKETTFLVMFETKVYPM